MNTRSKMAPCRQILVPQDAGLLIRPLSSASAKGAVSGVKELRIRRPSRSRASCKFGGEPVALIYSFTRARRIYTFDHISTNTRPPGIERASPRLPSPATNTSPPSSQRSHFTSTTPQPTPTISSISGFNLPHKTLLIRQNGTTGAANLALLQLNSAKEPVKIAEP
jgi:hypothetical protein